MRHLSVTQHGIWTWGLYVSIEEYVGIRIPTMDLTYILKDISAGIVLPSTSASFLSELLSFLKK